jgi:hypothetical protein
MKSSLVVKAEHQEKFIWPFSTIAAFLYIVVKHNCPALKALLDYYKVTSLLATLYGVCVTCRDIDTKSTIFLMELLRSVKVGFMQVIRWRARII